MSKKAKSLSNVFESLQNNPKVVEAKEETASKEDVKEEKQMPKQKTDVPVKEAPKEVVKANIDPVIDSDEEPISQDDGEINPDDAQNPFGESLINKFNEKKRTPTIEETHTRNTVLLRNDLHKRMLKLTKNRRGLKTMLVNEAIEAVLDAVEGNKK